MYSNPGDTPEPNDKGQYIGDRTTKREKTPLGRPKEKASKRNTQDDNFGKDRLGSKGMKRDYNDPKKSPLALESNAEFVKHQSMLKSIPKKKKLVFEQNNAESSLLDESNIKEQ